MSESPRFPILNSYPKIPDCPASIPWGMLNEDWAERNHGQTLKRLAERGGLSPCEALANIEKRRYHRMSDKTALETLCRYERAFTAQNKVRGES